MSRTLWRALLCALAFGVSAEARPYRVADLLSLRELGPVSVSANGRHVLFELTRPYRDTPSFDHGTDLRAVASEILEADLERTGRPTPAFPQSSRCGYSLGLSSPLGDKVLVNRLCNSRWEAGVLDLIKRHVRWLGFGIERADFGPTALWRSDTELIVLAMARDQLPYRFRFDQTAMDRLPALWREAQSGQAATGVLLGTGVFSGVHPPGLMFQLLVVDARTGGSRRLATGDLESLRLSPLGDQISVIERRGLVEQKANSPTDPLDPWQRRSLSLINLRTGTVRSPAPLADLPTDAVRWSSDGQVLFLARPTAAQDWRDARYYRIDVSGAVTPIDLHGWQAVGPGNEAPPDFKADWLGSDPIVLASRDGERADWIRIGFDRATNLTASLSTVPTGFAARTPQGLIFTAPDGVWLLTLNGGLTRVIDHPVDRLLLPRRIDSSVPSLVASTPPLNNVLAVTRRGDTAEIWSVEDGKATRIQALRLSANSQILDGSKLALVSMARDDHGVVELSISAQVGARHLVLEVNPQLRALEFATPFALHHTGPKGEALVSWLYRPVRAHNGKPPLIVMGYPGAVFPRPPYSGTPGVLGGLDDNAQIAAGHGYAVLLPSLPQDMSDPETGRQWAPQIDALLDEINQGGWADIHRAAFWGHSFGGYAALELATQTSRFKAILASAAPADLISLQGESRPSTWLLPDWPFGSLAGWTERGYQGHLMGTPWTDRERFIRNSALFQADAIQTPLLLVQGDQDFISVEQGRQMFSALHHLNKDALLMTFYGEGHSIMSPLNLVEYDRVAFAFLDKYLKPGAGSGEAILNAANPSLDRGGAQKHRIAADLAQPTFLQRRVEGLAP